MHMLECAARIAFSPLKPKYSA